MATADQILRRVLVRAGWPADVSKAPLGATDILELCDDEITGTLWPQLHASQGDWHLATRDYTLEVGTARYRLPLNMWGPIKELLYVDAAGEARDLVVMSVHELGRLPLQARPRNDTPFFIYVDGDHFGIWPTPTSTEITVRVIYYRAPSPLCLEAAARRVTAVVDDETFTLASTIATFESPAYLDFVAGGSGHAICAENKESAGVVGTQLNMGESFTGVEVGDWVCLTGFTPLAQIPDHMVPQLCDVVAAACANSFGDDKTFARNLGRAREREQRGMPTLDPRVEAEPVIIVGQDSAWRR